MLVTFELSFLTMMDRRDFVGREEELARLRGHLDRVRRTGRGRLLSVRGRRQVGKSRLLTEFADSTDLPQLFFTASRAPSRAIDLQRFADEAAGCSLPGADTFRDVRLESWEAALRLLASALSEGPCIVVIDEFPWLVANDSGLEGTLQTLWDRVFESRPVLFVLVGSDLSMMEALTGHGRPLYGRAKQFVVRPLSPADTAGMLTLSPADALDAYLVTGGYPRLLIEWDRSQQLWEFLEEQLAEPTSDVIVTGQRVLDAEFPSEVQAAVVLRAIGSGERSFRNLRGALELEAHPLSRSLAALETGKRIIARDVPVSAKPSRETRYRVDDPFLRFWLRFVEPNLPDIERGRPDLAVTRVRASWPDYRGQAVEPVVRDALTRLAAADERLGGAAYVGGWWPRSNNPQVDLVGVDRGPGRENTVRFVGSIKWRERAGFDDRDMATLYAHRQAVPGASEAPLVAVTRTGRTRVSGLSAFYAPEELLAAWRLASVASTARTPGAVS